MNIETNMYVVSYKDVQITVFMEERGVLLEPQKGGVSSIHL